MPYPVQNLIEDRGEPISVHPNDTAERALGLMIEHDFSQLPVIDESMMPLGMVTHESILRALANFRLQIDALRVADALVKAPIYNPEDDLFDLLDRLRDTNSVLIVDSEGRLIGIVTSYDSTEYFRRRAEDLMLVEDIESTIKDLITSAFIKSDGSIDEVGLSQAISDIVSSKSILENRYRGAITKYVTLSGGTASELDQSALQGTLDDLTSNHKQKSFDKLSFNEYIDLFLSKDRWGYYEKYIPVDPKSIRKFLDDVRETRNSLAHFRGEISASQRDQLKFAADWLARYQIPIEIQLPVETEILKEEEFSVLEPKDEYLSEAEKVSEIIPTEESLSRGDSRYTPMITKLESIPGSKDRVQFTFQEIENIIMGDLPPSAKKHRAWWANDAVGHAHSRAWLNAGWRVSFISMSSEKVTFMRVRERENAYIKFFSVLLDELGKIASFEVKESSPDGTNWIVVYTLPEGGPQMAILVYSFARDKRFRVELYIDTGDEERNKQVFDQIYSEKSLIETEVGETLNWERMDDKRASRIALYHDGSIEDPEPELAKLRSWAVEGMNKFFDAVVRPTTEALR